MSVLNVARIILVADFDVLKRGRNIRKHSESALQNPFNAMFSL